MALCVHSGDLIKQTGLWPELVAYNCLLNCVFLTGKRGCLLPFWGIIVMGMGECHHGSVGMVRGVTISGSTGTWWYHSHSNQK